MEGLHTFWQVYSNLILGIGINALVSAEPGWPAAGVAYHDTAVWLERITCSAL